MLDELDKYFEDFEKEVQEAVRSSLSSARSQSKPFMAGFSFKLGPEGKPTIQFFGDNPTQHDGYRSPMSEQFVDEKAGLLRVVLDMPGVEKGDIEVDATEESSVVRAERGNRKYRAEIPLKVEVEPDSGKAEYRNGLLEISFSLKDKANKGFKRVNIV
ncbi:MAG: Hsp20 family protein [Thaumarchaeota archaeon]|nr:Hsp20 family protein [Nitrososphaerota archaeon]